MKTEDYQEFADKCDQVDRGYWMQTYSHKRFFPADPRPSDICMTDIAHALSNLCRYGGHSSQFYSVAEHSYLIAQHALRDGWLPEGAMCALLHDAAEAYVVDMPHAPKKVLGAAYADLEDRVFSAILTRYDLHAAHDRYASRIKECDVRIIPLERQALMASNLPWDSDVVEPLPDIVIQAYNPGMVKALFVSTYYDICARMGITSEIIN